MTNHHEGNVSEVSEQDVIEQMERYFASVLEVPRPEFGGLPACPYVKQERLARRILYRLSPLEGCVPSEANVRMVREFADNANCTTLLIVDPIKRISVADCVAYGVELTRRASDRHMIAIAVHPDDPFEVAGFRTRGVPFPTMLCQSVDLLRDAKERLQRTSYYESWTAAGLDYNYLQIGAFL